MNQVEQQMTSAVLVALHSVHVPGGRGRHMPDSYSSAQPR
jgi:hypothetical protein